jgi:O-antigen/teichoic acid export membrane protein
LPGIQPLRRYGLHAAATYAEDKSIWHRLRQNVAISIFGSGFSVGLKLAQTVLLTRFLKIDDYGRVLIVLNLSVFLDSFFGLRVSDVMFRFFQPLKDRKEDRALKSLLWLCLGICLGSGLLIYLGILILSRSLSTHLYSDPGLSILFKIYGLTLLITAFSGVYEPILRIFNRFSAIVVPQVLGSLITLVLLISYFATIGRGDYDLRVIVASFVIGAFAQSLPPLFMSLWLVVPVFTQAGAVQRSPALAKYRPELIRCLLNSNLSGYLKFAVNPGDVFLLGLFSSPTQVALYGFAKQLASPLSLLQTTIQTAITPEITTLLVKRKLQELQSLIRQYLVFAFIFGGALLLSLLLLGRFLILHFFAAQYLAALPVYYLVTVAAWLLLVSLVFRPLAVNLDLLKWHNVALLLSLVIIVVLTITGRLNALTMAYALLAEASILRLSFGGIVWRKLQHLRTTMSEQGV